MAVSGAAQRIQTELLSWSHVEAHPHHLLPDSGWVSLYLREAADIDRVPAISLATGTFT